MMSKIKYLLSCSIIIFTVCSSCHKDNTEAVVYHWSKDEVYPNYQEKFTDTFNNIEQSIKYYTNQVLNSGVIDSVLKNSETKLGDTIFKVKETSIRNEYFYKIQAIKKVKKGRKRTFLGNYFYSPNYGIILRGHPTFYKVDSILIYRGSNNKEVIDLTKTIKRVFNDTILFPKPPSPPTLEELNEKFGKK